jgi:ankyrin repeat protein
MRVCARACVRACERALTLGNKTVHTRPCATLTRTICNCIPPALTPAHRNSPPQCIMFNDIEEFRALITLTEEVDKKLVADGRRALHFAAQEGCHDVAGYLIQLSAGVNVMDDLGRTALHLAAAHSDPTMAINLIESGASCNQADSQGVTPVHTAAEMSVAVLTELLARPDRDLAAKDDYGCQPVHYAARQVEGKVEAIELLLGAGVDVMATDRFGRSPMHHAAAAGNADIVKLLFQKGGLLESKDGEGHSPLLSAAAANQYNSAKMLLELGASLHQKDSLGVNFIELASGVGGLALMAAVEHLHIGKPSGINLLPAGAKFVKYAIPGTLSALAGDPRVPQSDRVFVQTLSAHNGSSDEVVMFAAKHESPTNGSYKVSPRYGFIKPNESVSIRIELRLPTSRLYKEFEEDRVFVKTAKIDAVDAIDVESERMWSRIPLSEQTRYTLGVKVRVIKPGEKPSAADRLFAL